MVKTLVVLAQFLLGIINLWATDTSMQLPSQAFWIKNHWPKDIDSGPPKQWRATSDLSPLIKEGVNTKGLAALHLSGSVSPSLNSLIWIKKQVGLNRSVYLIDLRQETHLYVNGLPISIFLKRDEINWGKSPALIHTEEQAWIEHLAKAKTLTINSLSKPVDGFKTAIDPITLKINESYSEAYAAAKANLEYVRIEVPDYHPPSPKQVDQFLNFLASIPNNAWLHFHCAGGKGRTTTFMTMTDIVHNGKQLPLETIIQRQALLGGINLLGTSSSLSAQPWKKDYHQAREEFIHLFYRYVHEAYPRESFSHWFKQQKKGAYNKILQTQAYYPD